MPSAPIIIPKEKLTIRFSRSGGPGGQNVNKVETKVELRFVVSEADWIPESIRSRLVALCSDTLTKGGELILASSRHRTQGQNLEECLRKLSALLEKASRRPQRRIPTRPTRGSQVRTARVKRHQSEKKRARRWQGDE